MSRNDMTMAQGRQKVSNTDVRRSIEKGGVGEFLAKPETAMGMLVGGLFCMLALPAAWMFMPLVLYLYGIWYVTRRSSLPFRNPITWPTPDLTTPHPGKDGEFLPSSGILSFGVTGRTGEKSRGEELWISNDDARRHMMIFGTTGSGKALPLDTTVLTESGWKRNGDLRPGDRLVHPFGGTTDVVSVHPQGALPVLRLWLADGRFVDCSADHLWKVRIERTGAVPEGMEDRDMQAGAGERVMEARDIGILHGAHGPDGTGSLRIMIPKARPSAGPFAAVTPDQAVRAGREGTDCLPAPLSLCGSVEDRRAVLDAVMAERETRGSVTVRADGATEISCLSPADAHGFKSLVRSLGGDALSWERGGALRCLFSLPRADAWDRDRDSAPDSALDPDAGAWIPLAGLEATGRKAEMSCIRTSRSDGLYVTEGWLATHNTELLLGLISQAQMWASGFIFVDGKGTRAFYARIWSLARRFGREDDVRVVNFMGQPDSDRPSGGVFSQTNTMNPFASGSSDNLMNLIVSLMGDAGSGNDMWKNRAMSLVTSAMKALVEMRDRGDILLNVQAIRDFLPLGKGFSRSKLGALAGQIESVDDLDRVPQEAWDDLRSRGGMIELYLRALDGEFSNSAKLALKGFFDSLPGFSIEKAMNGDGQEGKASEQYGFLSMQLTKPLGSLADDFGHIFNTQVGEVDIFDVALNRRILIALLPALQKAPEEMSNCGRIIVSMTKMMMAGVSGSTLQGGFSEIIEADPTKAPSPFICVLDEVGYYLVPGIDVMMAQARSLGFMVILAAQDMAAMQKGGQSSAQVAETAMANASTLAVGKTVDGGKTMEFINKVVGEDRIAESAGYTAKSGLFGTVYEDRGDVSFREVSRIKVGDVQNMAPGQFFFLFDGSLKLARTFYAGEDFASDISVNKFLRIRGPMDRVPGLDQSVEIRLLDSMASASLTLGEAMAGSDIPDRMVPSPERCSVLTSILSHMERFSRLSGMEDGDPELVRPLVLGLMAELEDSSDGSLDEWDIIPPAAGQPPEPESAEAAGAPSGGRRVKRNARPGGGWGSQPRAGIAQRKREAERMKSLRAAELERRRRAAMHAESRNADSEIGSGAGSFVRSVTGMRQVDRERREQADLNRAGQDGRTGRGDVSRGDVSRGEAEDAAGLLLRWLLDSVSDRAEAKASAGTSSPPPPDPAAEAMARAAKAFA